MYVTIDHARHKGLAVQIIGLYASLRHPALGAYSDNSIALDQHFLAGNQSALLQVE